MSLLNIILKSGTPVNEQIVEAARKAIVTGAIKPGEAFPSVRSVSAELQVNPNTVQKAYTVLKNEGLIEVHPGIGAVVTAKPTVNAQKREEILGSEMESLVLRARQFALSKDQLIAALERHWAKLIPED